jgi:virginiamycin A acetyltransferase
MAVLKRVASLLATLSVLPLLIRYRLEVFLLPGRVDLIFEAYSQRCSMFRGLFGMYRRRAFYRHTLWRCAPDCSIGFGTWFATPQIEIGRGVYIGAYCNLGHVTLGNDVLIGSNVHILSGKRQHSFERSDAPIRAQGGRFDRVTVGEDVWIGNGAIVMADIGAHAVVAAGAVVPSSVEPWSIVGGNPMRVIGTREASAAAVA